MKTFPEIWASYTARHPQLRDPDAVLKNLPVSQLKAALELAYEAGFEAGRESVKGAEPNPFPSFFDRGRK